jgi:glutathione synthase/RimK-type ligase-like ATP-grasp enzyme
MARDQIVIVTNQDDIHADGVIRALWGIGGEPIRLNTDEIPQDSTVSIELAHGLSGAIELSLNGLVVDPERIRSVWWRRPEAFRLPDGLSAWEYEFAQRELEQAYRGLWSALDCYWMSHPDAIDRAQWKLGQLRRAVELGFQVPRTLVTSDPQRALAFHADCGGAVVYKVMTGPFMAAERLSRHDPDAPEPEALQTPTTLVGDAELAQIDSIRTVPALFQERVPKHVELRVTVVGDELFVAEIDSQSDERTQIDFRVDYDAVAFRPGELPQEVADRCMALVRGYGLSYSAIDLILTPDGRHVFLECNPNGQFAFVEELVPELPLTAAVAARLLRGDDA